MKYTIDMQNVHETFKTGLMEKVTLQIHDLRIISKSQMVIELES
jgi:hypothetical protein